MEPSTSGSPETNREHTGQPGSEHPRHRSLPGTSDALTLDSPRWRAALLSLTRARHGDPRARAGCSNCGARHCGTHRPAVTARRPEVAVTALLTSTRDGGLRFACSSSINFVCAVRGDRTSGRRRVRKGARSRCHVKRLQTLHGRVKVRWLTRILAGQPRATATPGQPPIAAATLALPASFSDARPG